MPRFVTDRGGANLVLSDSGLVLGRVHTGGEVMSSHEVLAQLGYRFSRRRGDEHLLVELSEPEKRARLHGEETDADADAERERDEREHEERERDEDGYGDGP